MQKVSLLVAFVVLIGLVGCTVPSTVTKTVIVEEDANGQVLRKTYTESITQGSQNARLKFKYLTID